MVETDSERMPESSGGRGRKRSVVAENAVMTAAYQLLASEGLKATTVEAIAQRAGVSKATIYKWWPNRGAVIMSAFLREARDALPYPDQMDMASIFDRLHRMAQEFHGPIGEMIRVLIAEGQSDPEISLAFRDGYVLARRKQGVEIIKNAIQAGLIRNADPDVVLDMLYAPLYYRLLVGHAPLSAKFIQDHVNLALDGLSPRASGDHSRGSIAGAASDQD